MTVIRKLTPIGLVGLVVLSSLSFTHPVFAPLYQVVNVMVAYDEELSATAENIYWLSPEESCRRIIQSVSWRFGDTFQIMFGIISYVSWDSNDSINNIGDLLLECINETSFYSGMTYNTMQIDILIAFSDQAIIRNGIIEYGAAHPLSGAVIVIETYLYFSFGQCTDNILQHELSHLYGAPDHSLPNLDCIMNLYSVDAGLDGSRPYLFTTENWCSDCITIINENKETWGREQWIDRPGGPGGPWPEPYSKEGAIFEP